MLKSQQAVELCTLLVEDSFSELFAHIFSVLNRFGILTLEELKSRSSLTDNQLRHGLVAMIQHHLVYHFREGGDTWYQANTQKAYYLVRSGKFLRIVGARLGEFAARVMTEILLHGHISIKELECLSALQSHQDTTNALEGRSSKIYSILQGLAPDRYILPVSEIDSQSPADRWAKAQQDGNDIHILHDLNEKENAKEVLIHAKELPSQWMSEDFVHSYHPKEIQEEDIQFSEGKHKILITPDLIITVNYKKLDVCLRNERYLGLAQQNLPYATAEVYKCLLHHIELGTESCRKNRRIEPGKSEEGQVFGAIGCREILNDIEPSLDLMGSIGQSGNEISNDNLNRNQKKAQAIDEHLGLLAQPPYEFVFRVIEGGDIRWQIKFDDLSRKLLEKELERIICSRYGDLALRVIRILLAKGKIDTECLQQTSLIPPEYLRKILNQMFAQGFVSVQEIPLPPPGKQAFLWYFDADRVSQQVLEDTYKCMSRTLQRLNLERRGYQALLDKASRSDVEGKESEYLTEFELKGLEIWKTKEAFFLATLGRLDNLVAVLRDF